MFWGEGRRAALPSAGPEETELAESTKGAEMSGNGSGPVVVDADGHVCEPMDLWERNLPGSMREMGPRVRWSDKLETQQLWVEDRVGIPMGLAGLGNAGTKLNQNFGNALLYEEMNPAGFDPHERVKVLDEEGLQVAVL